MHFPTKKNLKQKKKQAAGLDWFKSHSFKYGNTHPLLFLLNGERPKMPINFKDED